MGGRGDPPRMIRVGDDLWSAFRAAVEADGESAAVVLRRFMASYVRRAEKKVR